MATKKPKLTAAEKQKRYREKRRSDAEREAAYKAKHKIRNARRKKIGEMSDREQRSQRKMWRKWDKERRKKESTQLQLPPTPPEENSSNDLPSGCQVRGRRKVLRNRSKCVRDNTKLKDQVRDLNFKLKSAQTRIEKYRKRLNRIQKKENDRVKRTPENELTPLSKAKKCLGSSFTSLKRKDAIKSKVVRTLIFHDSLVKSLKSGYQSLKKKQHKRVVSSLLMSSYIRRYRLQGLVSRSIGLAGRKRLVEKVHAKESAVKFEIERFFLCDDVSKVTAGMKETITKKKIKMQKRYLVTSMKKLYKTFLESRKTEKPNISYKTFTRYRPFYVCKPSEVSRDTCLCKQHSNITFKTKKLKQLKLVNSENPHDLYKSITSEKSSVLCMYGKCIKCKNQNVPILVKDENEQVTWQKWDDVLVAKEKTKQGEKVQYQVKVATKISVTKPLKMLVEEVQNDLKIFKKHVFNIKNQNNAYKTLKDSLSDNEALLHIDFSENYSCKLSEEIQSFHFGASRDQATLHTGVILVRENQKPIPFCSISASRDHNPAAIWAHLDPVLRSLSKDYPNVNTVHFFSDGPCTQYRQKKNFFLFSTLLLDMGFQCGTWNFFEASHGKGAPDGVGGALKRTANSKVAHGIDIPDAITLYNVLKEDSSVTLYLVDQSEIDRIDKIIPKDLTVVPGTLQIHQVVTNSYGKIVYRPLSCFCSENNWLVGKLCNCLIPFKTHNFTNLSNNNDTCKETVASISKPSSSIKRKQKIMYSDVYSSSDTDADDPVEYVNTDEEEIDLDEVICSTDPEVDANLPILQQPSTENVRKGVHVLVKLVGGERKKTTYQYVGVCQTDIEEDGEVKVMFLNIVGENGTLFKTNESDISYIDYNQIVGVLPNPDIKLKGNRVFYKFPASLDVFEQGKAIN